MVSVSELINKLHFTQTYYVEGRESIADLFRPNKRCGIYLLHFANGEYYIGQAVDVTRRYVQHRKNHHDVQRISFRRVNRDELDETERSAIWSFERNGFALRNITFMSMPSGDADFDLIMSPEQQTLWLENLHIVDTEGSRVVNPALRQRYAQRFIQFQHQPFADQSIKVLKLYAQRCLPALKRGEISFWSCSCLPSYKSNEVQIYARINIYWQEVFTVYRGHAQDDLGFSWHLSLSPLTSTFGESLSKLKDNFDKLIISDHFYEPGGADQVNLVVEDYDETLRFLHHPDIIRAIRLFNLRLMRKGTCTFNRYHCLALADLLTA